jgi:N-acetylneuraminic acid mutarotase
MGGRMRHCLLPSLLMLGALGIVGCGEETTQPNSAQDHATVPQLAVTSNTWLTRRDMPLELVYQAAADVPNAQGQSILYVIGGYKAETSNGFVPVGEVRAYNAATDTWTSKKDMPAARFWMNGAGVIAGKIYVTGGLTGSHHRSASVFVYDPGSNTWTRKADMPAAGSNGVTGVIGGKLYVVTFSGYGVVPNFFRYNPATDSWTKLPSPTNYALVGEGGGGVINKKLYLISHAVVGEPSSRLLEYDPNTNKWTRKNLPDFASDLWGGPMTVVMLNHLYTFAAPDIFIYDPVSDTWETKPLLTKFSYWADYELTAARVFLNGQPRVQVIGGPRPGNNQQYIP